MRTNSNYRLTSPPLKKCLALFYAPIATDEFQAIFHLCASGPGVRTTEKQKLQNEKSANPAGHPAYESTALTA